MWRHCILYNVSETAIYIHYSMINTKLDFKIWSFRYKKDLQDPTTANLQEDEEIEFEIYDSIWGWAHEIIRVHI